jgi:hypothetical protein
MAKGRSFVKGKTRPTLRALGFRFGKALRAILHRKKIGFVLQKLRVVIQVPILPLKKMICATQQFYLTEAGCNFILKG